MRGKLLKITLFAFITFSFSNIKAQDAWFDNEGGLGNGKWSTITNWATDNTGTTRAGAIPGTFDKATLLKSVILDMDATIGVVYSGGTTDITITGLVGTETLSIDGINPVIIKSDTDNTLTFDCNVDIKSSKNIDTSTLINSKLVFSAGKKLTMTATGKFRSFSSNSIEINGDLYGNQNFTVATPTPVAGSATYDVSFGSFANNASFDGTMFAFTEDIVSNIISPNLFLKSTATINFNSTGGSITLNGANTMSGIITRSVSAGGISTIYVNANQSSVANLRLFAETLILNMNPSVTEFSIGTTLATWGGTLDIVGFKEDVLKFGATLTAAQLLSITHDGTPVALAQRANGYIVYSTTLGIDEVNFKDDTSISIYPNPVQNELKISSNNNNVIEKLEVYSILGQKISVEENNNVLNVSSLVSGTYIVKIFHENETISTKRFIKE